MAKDGTNRGGARVGAGRKKKPLAEKIAEGKAENAKALLKAKIATPEKLAEILGMPLEQLQKLAAEVQ